LCAYSCCQEFFVISTGRRAPRYGVGFSWLSAPTPACSTRPAQVDSPYICNICSAANALTGAPEQPRKRLRLNRMSAQRDPQRWPVAPIAKSQEPQSAEEEVATLVQNRTCQANDRRVKGIADAEVRDECSKKGGNDAQMSRCLGLCFRVCLKQLLRARFGINPTGLCSTGRLISWGG